MPVEHCLQNDTRPVKASFTPLISVISVCFEYPSCTLQSFQHVIDFNLRVKIAARILCTRPVSLSGPPMVKKFTVWPWIFFSPSPFYWNRNHYCSFCAAGQLLLAWRPTRPPSFSPIESSQSEFFFKAISLSRVTSGGLCLTSQAASSASRLNGSNYFQRRRHLSSRCLDCIGGKSVNCWSGGNLHACICICMYACIMNADLFFHLKVVWLQFCSTGVIFDLYLFSFVVNLKTVGIILWQSLWVSQDRMQLFYYHSPWSQNMPEMILIMFLVHIAQCGHGEVSHKLQF